MTIRTPAPLEFRAGAKVDGVDFAERIITVIAVPYDEPAKVEYRSEVWSEIFCRGALDGVSSAPHRIRVNRDHDNARPVGKAVRFWPDRVEGCVTEIRIAKTLLGDETLALADEDCLSSSVGFGVMPSDQELDRRTMTRRIKRAYLDHVAFVQSPAYSGAQVLSVRGTDGGEAAGLTPLRTPVIDEFTNDEILRWASQRLNKQ